MIRWAWVVVPEKPTDRIFEMMSSSPLISRMPSHSPQSALPFAAFFPIVLRPVPKPLVRPVAPLPRLEE